MWTKRCQTTSIGRYLRRTALSSCKRGLSQDLHQQQHQKAACGGGQHHHEHQPGPPDLRRALETSDGDIIECFLINLQSVRPQQSYLIQCAQINIMEVDFSCYHISWPVSLAHGIPVTGMRRGDTDFIKNMLHGDHEVVGLRFGLHPKIVSFLFALSEVRGRLPPRIWTKTMPPNTWRSICSRGFSRRSRSSSLRPLTQDSRVTVVCCCLFVTLD